jgi:hypothetical protein
MLITGNLLPDDTKEHEAHGRALETDHRVVRVHRAFVKNAAGNEETV